MPISPSQARKLAESIRTLITKIDNVIVESYIKFPHGNGVEVDITKEQYDNVVVQQHLREQYQTNWEVSFTYRDMSSASERARGDCYDYYYIVLRERR